MAAAGAGASETPCCVIVHSGGEADGMFEKLCAFSQLSKFLANTQGIVLMFPLFGYASAGLSPVLPHAWDIYWGRLE